MPLLSIDHVSKRYGDAVANDDVCLRIHRGEVFGLLGPNGAGKTTLVKQILGLLVPDGGRITIAGADVVADPAAARRLCSYQPQASAPVDGLTARETVHIVGAIRGGQRAAVRARAGELLAALDLDGVADRKVPMSGGMSRLTGFCMALVVPGEVVVLDEPTNDVDPLRRRALWKEIRRVAEDGAAVLLVTHNVLEAERCVDRLAILAAGRVVAEGAPGVLKAQLGGPLRLECALEAGAGVPTLPAGASLTAVIGRRVLASVQPADVSGVVTWAQRAQARGVITEFNVSAASLEDVYARWVDSQQNAA